MNLKDKPAPYCIYKRTRENDSNFKSVDVLWLVGYKSRIDSNEIKLDEIKPKSESGAILILTKKMIRKILEGTVTYKDIDISDDGSKLILSDDVNFNFDAKAIPSGLALIVSADLNQVD